jgi:hypothetical protein
MAAELLIDERHVLDARTFVEIVVWRLPRPSRARRFIRSSIGWRSLSMKPVCCGTTMKQGRATTGTCETKSFGIVSWIQTRYSMISGATLKA